MRQRSLYRNTVSSKQNSPVRNHTVQEFRRFSPRKSLLPSMSACSQSRSSNSKSWTVESSHSGLMSSESTEGVPMSCANRERGESDSMSHEASLAIDDGDVGSQRERQITNDDDSSSVEILPEPESESERYIYSSSNCSSPPALPAPNTSAAAAVTIPAVITTTPDNVVCTDALISAETNTITNESDNVPVISHKRTVSVDDDEDKERAVGTSPDGR